MSPAKWSPRTWFVVAIAAAAFAGALIIWIFGGEDFLIQLAASFGASLLAFAVALSWERDRARREMQAEDERLEESLSRQIIDREKETKEEITRLLQSVSRELKMNERGLEDLETALARDHANAPGGFRHALPLLYDGAWAANAPRLVQILDYADLLSDLANFYAEIEELRFRARYRIELQTHELDAGIEALVRSATDKLKKLGPWVDRVAENPIVGPLRLQRDLPVPRPLQVPARRRNA